MFTYGANPFPSFSHEPLPHSEFLKMPKKYTLVAGTEPITAMQQHFKPQSTTLTIRPSNHGNLKNIKVRI